MRTGTSTKRANTSGTTPSATRVGQYRRSPSRPHRPSHHAFDGSSSSCHAARRNPLGGRRRRAAPIPYGVYDMARNEAWVSVGRDHDTPAFAVASIRHWWQQMGCDAYPDATALFITADAGGSNGLRSRAWKHELQQLADETRLTIHVSHFPPGTGKWNKIFEVRAVHSRELRTALSKACVAGGRTAPAYTDPVIVALLTPGKGGAFHGAPGNSGCAGWRIGGRARTWRYGLTHGAATGGRRRPRGESGV